MNQQTQKPVSRKKEIRDLLEADAFKDQIQRALPEGMRADRFVRIAVTATVRNPDLLSCTQESFFKYLFDLGAMGLEPDGRRAHLIPFKDNRAGTVVCTMIVDYKGIAELVRRNGDVSSIHCDVVGRNDVFVCRYGSGGKLEHIPLFVDRGDPILVYSYVTLKGGSEEWDVMSIEEVEKVRKRSRSADKGPWVTDYLEMCKKTVFRRHSKTLPLSPEVRNAVEYDEENEFGFERAVPARTPPKSRILDAEAPKPPEPGEIVPPAGIAAAGAKAATAFSATEKSESSIPSEYSEPKKAEEKPAKRAKSPTSATKADQLEGLLSDHDIKWSDFSAWVSQLTGIVAPGSAKDMPPNILVDCVANFSANREAFEIWLARIKPEGVQARQ